MFVCPSSRHHIVSKRPDESNWNEGFTANEIYVPPKIRLFPTGTFSQTLDIQISPSLSCSQQNSLTVELATVMVDASWLFTTRPSTVILHLYYFDLLRTCTTCCTVYTQQVTIIKVTTIEKANKLKKTLTFSEIRI